MEKSSGNVWFSLAPRAKTNLSKPKFEVAKDLHHCAVYLLQEAITLAVTHNEKTSKSIKFELHVTADNMKMPSFKFCLTVSILHLSECFDVFFFYEFKVM